MDVVDEYVWHVCMSIAMILHKICSRERYRGRSFLSAVSIGLVHLLANASMHLPKTVGSLHIVNQSSILAPPIHSIDKYILYSRKVSANRARRINKDPFPTFSNRQSVYPLVKTFNNDVLPHAPSPLFIQLISSAPTHTKSRGKHASQAYKRTSFRCTVLLPPQRGMPPSGWNGLWNALSGMPANHGGNMGN